MLRRAQSPPCDCRYCRLERDAHQALKERSLGLIVLVLAGALVAFALLGGCGPVPAPRPPATPTWSLDVQTAPGASLVVQDGPNAQRKAQAGPDGRVRLTGLVQSGFTLCASAAGYAPACVGVTLTRSQAVSIPLTRVVVQLPALRADGRIFRTADGAAWRWRGVSAFKLLDRFRRGEPIDAFLDTYAGFNVLRVWAYVEGSAWQGRDWPTPPTAEETRAFLAYVGARGWYVELTLLTDDTPARLTWAKTFMRELAALSPRPTNLVLELVNEPGVHAKHDPARLRTDVEASGFVYASGEYLRSARIFGTYLVHHSPRDAEWPRKAHDCLEFYNGGGPHAKTDPPHRVPCVLDEPGKPQDMKGGISKADDVRAYFGTAALLGAGATWHCETCKYAELPTAEERTLAAAALEGLTAFPADAALGPYSRPSDASLRTYVVGRYKVRVRPTTEVQDGWTRIGTSAVLWRR